MSAVAERHESLVAAFDAVQQDLSVGSAERQARARAFDRFLSRGFPTTREEEWRYTNVAPIAAIPFERAEAVSLDREAIAPHLFAGLPAIVVVNGRVSKELSAFDRLPAGVTVWTHSSVRPPQGTPTAGLSTKNHFSLSAESIDAAGPMNPFPELNTAFFEDGVGIEIADRAVVTEPIQILAIAVSRGRPSLVAPRVLIHVGEQAQASIVEAYAGIGQGQTLTCPVTEIYLEASALLNHVKIQNEPVDAFHLANMRVRLSRASTFTSQALTFGGRIARNDITATLDGEGAECTLNGLYVATGDSLVDTHTTIDHAKAHCPSHEVYKGILGGRARAVFNGKILVRPDAQKTDAKQTNRALLLTDEAQVNTKPQLEIFADDVKCTHGAAIGQLDDDAMFYLRARGIDENAARIMLIHAFAGQILDGIKNPAVREAAMHLVDRKLSIE